MDTSAIRRSMEVLTPKSVDALKLLVGTSHLNTISASALAGKLWPEKLAECVTSARRKGYARSAGSLYSKLQKQGFVAHWIDDFSGGYYLTSKGLDALLENGVKVSGELSTDDF